MPLLSCQYWKVHPLAYYTIARDVASEVVLCTFQISVKVSVHIWKLVLAPI